MKLKIDHQQLFDKCIKNNMKKKLIIYGLGEMARLAHYYFTNADEYNVELFTVDKEYMRSDKYLGLNVTPFEEIEKRFPPDEYCMFIAIGYKKVNKIRAEYYYKAKEKRYKLVNYISPRATTFEDLELGDNCFIFEDNTIQPFVKIGNNVILWSGNHIGHNAVIKDHCFVTSHVVVSSHVTIDEYSFLGVNSTIRNNIIIAKECVIGAGALILKNTIEKGVYVGNSAVLSNVQSDRLKDL